MSMQSGSAAMTGKPLIESDRVEGTTVYDPQGKNIGRFLGMGTEEHAIPWNKLTYDTSE